ncbi:SprB repeat-containing protein [Hymenobacter aerilatus]|uniref:SprB repeat-containing protein n=1 Tax=Hymenobacter aerilatus TaxID=2932251 RepID=A0A8T9T2F9_9BACT|nr:SprB repeat-containing protein [Hymenobacter aerilatus]UOR06750.1 SprB repeat-containing protein [Hymenobacter aerilatus]
MLIDLKIVYTFYESWRDPQDDRISEDRYWGATWRFDTVTRKVVYQERGTNYARWTGEGAQDDYPLDYYRPTDKEVFAFTEGDKRYAYFHDGEGDVVLQEAGIFVDFDVVQATCFGGNTASIVLAVSGTDGPYTYQWADGPTTKDRSLVKGGVQYTVTVTDVPTGMRKTVRIDAGQNPRIEVLVRKTDNNLVLEVSGGVAPYTYAWEDGATTAAREGLAPGIYQCEITDAVGCSQTVDVTIEGFRFYWSGNPITLSLDAGSEYRDDPATKPDLTFLCEVWLEEVYGSGVFVQIGTVLEQPADRDGRTVFQVEELLDAYLDYYVPAVWQATITQATPLFRRFYLQYAEVFGEPPVRDAATVLTQNFVLRGGLSRYEGVARTYQDSYRPLVRPFLTWQPNDKAVYLDQPEFLYYLVDSAVTEFELRLRVRYDDDSTEERTVATQEGVARFEVYCLPAGFQQLGLADTEERHVVGWEVWVSSTTGTAQTETRRYQLDRRPVRQRRYLVYANSLGGMDTVAMTGEGQLDAEVVGEEVERSPVPFPDPLLDDQLVLDRTLRPVLKLAGGVRDNSREWLAAQQELLLSRRVLLLTGPRWQPVVVKAQTTTIRKEGENVQTLELVLQLPRERFYTPRLGATAVTRHDLLLP